MHPRTIAVEKVLAGEKRRSVAKQLGVAASAIIKWIKRYLETGSGQPEPDRWSLQVETRVPSGMASGADQCLSVDQLGRIGGLLVEQGVAPQVGFHRRDLNEDQHVAQTRLDTSGCDFSLTWIPSFEFPARLFSRLLSEKPGAVQSSNIPNFTISWLHRYPFLNTLIRRTLCQYLIGKFRSYQMP